MKRFFFIFTTVILTLVCSALAANVIITSFNSGILSPTLSGRIDFSKYVSGLQTCLNAIPLPQGGVTRRPGTEYLGETTSEARLIPFVFSEDQAYMLEFSDLRMRVWADGGRVQTVDSNTEVLLHADGFDSYATFTDSGTNIHTVTTNAQAQIDTSQYKFGGSSAYFDGSGDYITISDSDGVNDYFHIGSSDYTIDFWMRTTSTSGNHGVLQQYDDLDNYVRMMLNGANDIDFTIRSAGDTKFAVITAGNYITANTWHHIAIVRDGNDIGYAVDGTWIMTWTDADMDWPDLAGDFAVGTNTGVGDYAGWIDEFRLSKAARWTIGTDFTPPTFAYPTGDQTGTDYVLVSPYSVGDLATLRYVQSADTMYLVHPDHIPYKLTRTAHDSWSFTAFAWDTPSIANETDQPPWQTINTTAITMDPSAVTGVGITITASASFFNSGHIGSYFKQKSGIYKITAVASGTSATATVVDDLTDHLATADWYESAWGIYRGYPSAVCFFENRLVFADNDNQPQTLWMSQTDDYEDFTVHGTVVDSDAVTITLAAEKVNAIKWLLSSRRLLVGTTGGEWWITGNASEEAVTPTSVLVRKATGYGSGGTQPLIAGGDVLFVQKPGKRIRKFEYKFDSDSYQATDLSVLAGTITEANNIEEIVFQQNPYQLLWCRLSDGSLATLSYTPEHDVYAWATHWIGHTGQGVVESVATIPGTTDDEVYFIVKRTIDSTTKWYIERLHNFYFAAIEDAVYVDSSLTYDSTPASTITGLSHLEGETVDVFGDGAIQADKTVTSGEITIATAASVVHVGLNYITNIETMRLSVGTPFQTAQGLLKRINKVTARLYNSMYAKAGPDASNLDTLISSYTAGDNDTEIRILQGRSTDGVVYIRSSEPAPLTVLALILDVEIY